MRGRTKLGAQVITINPKRVRTGRGVTYTLITRLLLLSAHAGGITPLFRPTSSPPDPLFPCSCRGLGWGMGRFWPALRYHRKQTVPRWSGPSMWPRLGHPPHHTIRLKKIILFNHPFDCHFCIDTPCRSEKIRSRCFTNPCIHINKYFDSNKMSSMVACCCHFHFMRRHWCSLVQYFKWILQNL